MALVKCPECGKEVSDTAVSCPGCGYAVKDHFAKIEVVKKEDEPVKISAKLVECKKCGAKLNQGTEMCFKCGTYQETKEEKKEVNDSTYVRCPNCDSKMMAVSKTCFKCGASLEQKGNSENNTINNRKPEPENQVTIGLGLVALAFVSLFLPFMQLGNLALSLAQIQLVLPILGLSLGLTAIFVINKKKSGVIAMNVFSILFTAFVYYAEFANNSGVSRFVSPGIGAFLLPIALIAIWVYYAKLRKEYGLAPNEKPIKGGRIVLGVILGIIILVALIVVVGLIRKAIRSGDNESDTTSESVVDTGVEETAKVEETKKEEPKQETKKETKVETKEDVKVVEEDTDVDDYDEEWGDYEGDPGDILDDEYYEDTIDYSYSGFLEGKYYYSGDADTIVNATYDWDTGEPFICYFNESSYGTVFDIIPTDNEFTFYVISRDGETDGYITFYANGVSWDVYATYIRSGFYYN